MQTKTNAWIDAGVRYLLKKAISKAMKGEDKRTSLIFNEMATESLLTFAWATFRKEVEVECAHWYRTAVYKREAALLMPMIDAERTYGKALAEADLMMRQSRETLDRLETVG